MGVSSLWSLLAPCGRRCSVNTLERKRLAVDVSIWLMQFIKAMRDDTGEMVRNAPLLGLLHRLCKLVYLHVRPVLVFDGATPALKQRTIARRRALRQQQEGSLRRTAERILLNQLKRRRLLNHLTETSAATLLQAAPTTAAEASTTTIETAEQSTQYGHDDAVAAAATFELRSSGIAVVDANDDEDLFEPLERGDDFSSDNIQPGSNLSFSELTVRANAKQHEERRSHDLSELSRLARGVVVVPNASELDEKVVRDLPTSLQAEVLDEVKAVERNRRCDDLVRHCHSVSSFSLQQLHNYVEVSKVALRIEELRNELNRTREARRIASDAAREYVLIDTVKLDTNGGANTSGSEGMREDLITDTEVFGDGNGLTGGFLPEDGLSLGFLPDEETVAASLPEDGEGGRDPVPEGEGRGGFSLEEAQGQGRFSTEATRCRETVLEEDNELARAVALSLASSASLSHSGAVESFLCDTQPSPGSRFETGLARSMKDDVSQRRHIGKQQTRKLSGEVSADAHRQSQAVASPNCPAAFGCGSRASGLETCAVTREQRAADEGGALVPLDAGLKRASTSKSVPQTSVAPPHHAAANTLGMEICLQDLQGDQSSDELDNELFESAFSGKGAPGAGPGTRSSNDWARAGAAGGMLSGHGAPSLTVDGCDQVHGVEMLEGEESARGVEMLEGEETAPGVLHGAGASPLSGSCMEGTFTRGVAKSSAWRMQAKLRLWSACKKAHSALPFPGASEVADITESGYLPGRVAAAQPRAAITGACGNDEFLATGDGILAKLDQPPPPTLSVGDNLASSTAKPCPIAGRKHSTCKSEINSLATRQALASGGGGLSTEQVCLGSRGEHSCGQEDFFSDSKTKDSLHLSIDMAPMQVTADLAVGTERTPLTLKDNMVEAAGSATTEDAAASRVADDARDATQPNCAGHDEVSSGLTRAKASRHQTSLSELSAEALVSDVSEVSASLMQDSLFSTDRGAAMSSEMVLDGSLPASQASLPAFAGSAAAEQVKLGAAKLAASQGHEAVGRDAAATSAAAERCRKASCEREFADNSDELVALLEEQRRARRDVDTVTEDMLEESKRLLSLFGLPYLVAPMEAESQCAQLELAGLVDGVITEDSDTFLFGARRVYRKLFNPNKEVEVYEMCDIEAELALSRDKLVMLAQLLGSDYTEGVHGIGIVNAMEVLSSWVGNSESLAGGLKSFAEWCRSWREDNLLRPGEFADSDKGTRNSGATKQLRDFKRKHRNVRRSWVLPEDFPSQEVELAYLRPQVDHDTAPCEWGRPDLEGLREFCADKFGWEKRKSDDLLLPVMQAYEVTFSQAQIPNYFSYDHKFARIRSQRLAAAVGCQITKPVISTATGCRTSDTTGIAPTSSTQVEMGQAFYSAVAAPGTPLGTPVAARDTSVAVASCPGGRCETPVSGRGRKRRVGSRPTTESTSGIESLRMEAGEAAPELSRFLSATAGTGKRPRSTCDALDGPALASQSDGGLRERGAQFPMRCIAGNMASDDDFCGPTLHSARLRRKERAMSTAIAVPVAAVPLGIDVVEETNAYMYESSPSNSETSNN